MSEKLSKEDSSNIEMEISESLEKVENVNYNKMERDELKKLIRTCVKEWCETTTSHGKSLTSRENIIKIISNF
jgi:hypothetical protein